MRGTRVIATELKAVPIKHFGANLSAGDTGIAAFRDGGRVVIVGGVRFHGGVLHRA